LRKKQVEFPVTGDPGFPGGMTRPMIRKLKSGEYRIYSRKKDAKSGKRRNLGTFTTIEKVRQRERQIQYFKHR
jgi:hypothetical protein